MISVKPYQEPPVFNILNLETSFSIVRNLRQWVSLAPMRCFLCSKLRVTVAILLAEKFEKYMGGLPTGSLIDNAGPRLLLLVGGGSIGDPNHLLLSRFESTEAKNPSSNGDDEVYTEEWFEDQQTRAQLMQWCDHLHQQRKLVIPGVNVSFGVASTNAALRDGKEVATHIDDIIMEQGGELSIVTRMLPKAPPAPRITVTGQTFAVAWSSEHEPEEELAIPTT